MIVIPSKEILTSIGVALLFNKAKEISVFILSGGFGGVGILDCFFLNSLQINLHIFLRILWS
jgi:hypothetical protein